MVSAYRKLSDKYVKLKVDTYKRIKEYGEELIKAGLDESEVANWWGDLLRDIRDLFYDYEKSLESLLFELPLTEEELEEIEEEKRLEEIEREEMGLEEEEEEEEEEGL
jgi:hypothetical protein